MGCITEVWRPSPKGRVDEAVVANGVDCICGGGWFRIGGGDKGEGEAGVEDGRGRVVEPNGRSGLAPSARADGRAELVDLGASPNLGCTGVGMGDWARGVGALDDYAIVRLISLQVRARTAVRLTSLPLRILPQTSSSQLGCGVVGFDAIWPPPDVEAAAPPPTSALKSRLVDDMGAVPFTGRALLSSIRWASLRYWLCSRSMRSPRILMTLHEDHSVSVGM